ncbi:MAG: nucleotidyl transferase AbiEii/AbiGii toxin family protein [Candidatus Marinimicrobia bacterium]|nr:nucleotidyl transferase AbiEii/AbiGii toxin family protein [Candidatus Neomarinimicrobiota bacterium]
MHLSKKNYLNLYKLQDEFLLWWKEQDENSFYLTGGTALGRYYLDNHRYSEDLDFFVNNCDNFKSNVNTIINNIKRKFKIDMSETLFYDDFSRIYICKDEVNLKIEFVNDIAYHSGVINNIYFGKIDSVKNIISNKLTALLGRDEAKDVFDIIAISEFYSFNWKQVFEQAKEKNVMNEIDVAERLTSFPVNWFNSVNWLNESLDLKLLQEKLNIISDDFFLGKDNSLGKDKISIDKAEPNLNS